MPDLLPLSLARRRPGRIRPGLEGLHRALDELGRPHDTLRSALVVGTNGKGSTVAVLDAVLRAHGVRVGRFTSPHLVSVRERIVVDGETIAWSRLEALVARLERFAELTFFETLTAAALLEFATTGVDVAVLEAGMGGRWDATRIAGSAAAGITNVGTDHSAWLGTRPEAIAADKGAAVAAARIGIIGPGLDPRWLPHLGAPHALHARTLVSIAVLDDHRLVATWPGSQIELQPRLNGRHQRDNLHLALALARGAEQLGWVTLEPERIAAGVAAVEWPGRLSWHLVAGRRVLLDGAHNLEAAIALAETLATSRLRPHLVFSCLDDKPVDAMAAALRPAVASVIVCALDDDRAMPLSRLCSAFPDAEVAASPRDAVERSPDPVLVAGSLRLVGALMELPP